MNNLIQYEISERLSKTENTKVVRDARVDDGEIYIEYTDSEKRICDINGLIDEDLYKHGSKTELNELYELKATVLSCTHVKDDTVYWRVEYDENKDILYIPLNSPLTDDIMISEVDENFLSDLQTEAYKISTSELYVDNRNNPTKLFKRNIREQSFKELYNKHKSDDKYINKCKENQQKHDEVLSKVPQDPRRESSVILSLAFSMGEDKLQSYIAIFALLSIGLIVLSYQLFGFPIMFATVLLLLCTRPITHTSMIMYLISSAVILYRKTFNLFKSYIQDKFTNNYKYEFTEINKL